MASAVIVGVVRTGSGKGKPDGGLAQVHPATLLATVLVSLLNRRYPAGLVQQGISAELVAAEYKLTRTDLDEFAARSHRLAVAAAADGAFASEIIPVQIDDESSVIVDSDETIRPGTTGPMAATDKVLKRAGPSVDDIDTFEVNEAFASVPLAWQADLATNPDRLNPRGGAIALGHPLGASGTGKQVTR
jgi:acetyl-CoA acetyltransferase